MIEPDAPTRRLIAYSIYGFAKKGCTAALFFDENSDNLFCRFIYSILIGGGGVKKMHPLVRNNGQYSLFSSNLIARRIISRTNSLYWHKRHFY